MRLLMLILVILIGLLILAFFFPYTIIFICGYSMYPTYSHGDLVLAKKFDYKVHSFKVGEVYIFSLGDRLIIKRLKVVDRQVSKAFCWFEGDNPNKEKTCDSRDFGWIDAENVKYIIVKDLIKFKRKEK